MHRVPRLMIDRDAPSTAGLRWRAALTRGALLTLGWGALTEGAREGWSVGLAVVGLATWASLRLDPPAPAPRWSLLAFGRFAFHFLVASLRGGFDVALRALGPGLRLDPVLVRHRLTLPVGSARNLFLGAVSLMPGTLSADLEGEEVVVHVLIDRPRLVRESLSAFEARVGRALGAWPLEPGKLQ